MIITLTSPEINNIHVAVPPLPNTTVLFKDELGFVVFAKQRYRVFTLDDRIHEAFMVASYDDLYLNMLTIRDQISGNFCTAYIIMPVDVDISCRGGDITKMLTLAVPEGHLP